MNAEFYLFDVDHGQCAALRLPNGHWCVFDLGNKPSFSPLRWIIRRATEVDPSRLMGIRNPPQFEILKATVSHLHGDHVADWNLLRRFGPRYLRMPSFDEDHLEDVAASSSDGSRTTIGDICDDYTNAFTARGIPNYGGASIREMGLSAKAARAIGGSAGTRVNNTSVITRIDVNGTSILLCGDMEATGWEYVLGGAAGPKWQQHVANVDVLVAPHHGHSSGFSPTLLRLARPKVVLVSVASKDRSVDSRYSSPEFVRGVVIGGTRHRCLTTRRQGHIQLTLVPPLAALLQRRPQWSWAFGPSAIGLNPSALLAALLRN